MSAMKKIFIILLSLILFIAVLVFWWYKSQTAWVESEPYQRKSKRPAETLVVVYSHTGNTLCAAKEIAKYFDADLLQIEAPQYSRDLKGIMLGTKNAKEEITTTPIMNDPVNLNQYDLVFLCSPTWAARPAVPLWSFVENHNFEGNRVVLVVTAATTAVDSIILKEQTQKFKLLVENKKGVFLDMLYINRTQLFWPKTADQVNRDVRNALDERKDVWRAIRSDDYE